jgi:crotonobetainyl-CoA:carnitine CoA-transferase CaiB-like acyl-CoA transferase
MCHFNLDAFTHYLSEGEVMGPFSRPSVSQSYVLRCSDGKWIALHMSSPEKFWQGLATAMQRPDIFSDPRYASREGRIRHYDDLIVLLRGIFANETRDVWCERLAQEDVPHAPMYDVVEVLDDPQVRHLKMEVSVPHPEMGTFRTIRFPIAFDGERGFDIAPPPILNEHGKEIRDELKKDH